MPAFYPLTVKSIIRETPQAVSIQFHIPEEWQKDLRYREGQYLAMRAMLDGEDVRRNYSYSSSPLDEAPTITVKEVAGGRMSTYLNRELQVGDTLEVMRPMGRFFAPRYENEGASYFLIGGGSGITPLMSIAKTVLHEEPNSHLHLLYGNESVEQTIFLEAWESLRQQYGERLTIQYVMQNPPQDRDDLSVWEGITNAANINRFLDEYVPKHEVCEYFTCGPAPMMEAVETILEGKGVDKKKIHLEYFTTAGKRSKKSTSVGKKP